MPTATHGPIVFVNFRTTLTTLHPDTASHLHPRTFPRVQVDRLEAIMYELLLAASVGTPDAIRKLAKDSADAIHKARQRKDGARRTAVWRAKDWDQAIPIFEHPVFLHSVLAPPATTGSGCQTAPQGVPRAPRLEHFAPLQPTAKSRRYWRDSCRVWSTTPAKTVPALLAVISPLAECGPPPRPA
jgi:hypothetical protein